MAVQIQIRRDLAAHWISANPTLAEGEAGYETNTGKIKYGDGTTAWNSLAYYGVSQLNAYLQVANAVSTFQTKSVERAALANTNLAITNVKTGLTTTTTTPPPAGSPPPQQQKDVVGGFLDKFLKKPKN